MNKIYVLIGAVTIIVFIFVSVYSNYTELTNIGDLQANPEKYLNLQVRVKGEIASSYIWNERGFRFPIRTEERLNGMYYLTGIIRQDESEYYLDVIFFEPI